MESTQTAFAPAVTAELDSMLRDQLLDRRDRLEIARDRNVIDPDVARLLSEVDAALQRFEKGTYGLCEECHDPIEADRLLADPLMRVCLGDLSTKQRQALETDLELASEIQNALLPRSHAEADAWAVDFVYQPAGIVSGDYVDVIRHDGELYFILGDVSGKGMAASLLMSNLHAMFHSLVPLGLPLHELMDRANRIFCESTLANQYATLICGKINAAGEVEMCNAGHLPPVLFKNGGYDVLDSTGLPLGMFCDSNFSASCVKLDDGDALLLYTDGVTEAVDERGEEFGLQRLIDSVSQFSSGEPGELVSKSMMSVENYRGNGAKTDDLTLLALKFAGGQN